MSAQLTLLDRALILAQHELDAMRSGDVDTAGLFFNERAGLLARVAEADDEQDPEDFRMKLVALQGYNQMICEEGHELLERIRAELLNARGNTRRARGYARVMHS